MSFLRPQGQLVATLWWRQTRGHSNCEDLYYSNGKELDLKKYEHIWSMDFFTFQKEWSNRMVHGSLLKYMSLLVTAVMIRHSSTDTYCAFTQKPILRKKKKTEWEKFPKLLLCQPLVSSNIFNLFSEHNSDIQQLGINKQYKSPFLENRNEVYTLQIT